MKQFSRVWKSTFWVWKKFDFCKKIVSYPRVWKYQLFFPDASLGARGSPCGSPPLERVDHLPWARGWSPLERVDHLPSSAWMASLGASERVDVPWVTLMGSPSITARLPGVVAQRVHAAAGTCITDEHKARGRQRAGATQRGATTSVCASLCQSFVAEVSRGGVLKTQTIFGPQLFKAVNKVFKSTSWFPWYKSFSLTCKAQRKFHPSIPNFYLKAFRVFFPVLW